MAFDRVKNQPLRNMFIKILIAAVEAGKTAPHYLVAPKDKIEKMIAAEPTYIKVLGPNPADPTSAFIQATEEGTAALGVHVNQPAPVKPAPVSYELVELDDLPEIKRGGNKGDSYPFASLAAPKAAFNEDGTPILKADGTQRMKLASFFVPVTEDRPNPAKSLSSTAASATKRYEKTDGREFTVRSAMDQLGKLIGAHVIRIK